MESADKGKDVSQGMLDKAKEGGSTGQAPVGYRNVGDSVRYWIEPEPDTAPKVKRLFEMAASSAYSLENLEKEAAIMGLRTRKTRRYPEGNLLQKTTLHGMLRNPTYKGMKGYLGYLYKGQHEALVSTELWERVQVALGGRRTCTERTKDEILQELFIMGGCVRCGICETCVMSPYRAKKGRASHAAITTVHGLSDDVGSLRRLAPHVV